MTTYQVVVSNRDGSDAVRVLPKMAVNHMTWAAIGGPAEASLTAMGNEESLWKLMEMLRCGVEIWDDVGHRLWWGMIDQVTVRVGALELRVGLSNLVNAVAVTYSYIPPGTSQVGRQKMTPWAEDADSIAEYGRREWISSQDGLTDAAALARRGAILASRRYPQGSVDPGNFGAPRGRVGYSGHQRSLSATLRCVGWWGTLGWRYGSVASVSGVSYTATTATEQAVGSATAATRLMQQVTIGGNAMNARDLWIYARRVGSPADNLMLGLYALDSSGSPTGSALATVTLAGSGLTPTLAWVGGTLSTEVPLLAGGQYAIQVSRSGVVDASNYYAVGVNTGLGYSGGVLRIYNGSSWVSRSPDADLTFDVRANNLVETSEQVRNLVTMYGQFFSGVTLDVASGEWSRSYRDGKTDALTEVLNLLKIGGPNDRRLLATVGADRRVTVWEEPAPVPVYAMDVHGQLYDAAGAQVQVWAAPSVVGNWMLLEDVLPAGMIDTTRLMQPELQFVEGVRWQDGRLQVAFRGQPALEDTLKLLDF